MRALSCILLGFAIVIFAGLQRSSGQTRSAFADFVPQPTATSPLVEDLQAWHPLTMTDAKFQKPVEFSAAPEPQLVLCCRTFDDRASESLLALPHPTELPAASERMISSSRSTSKAVTSRAVSGDGKPAGVQWKPLLLQSLYYLAIEHSYRIATEPGTRSGMHNSVVGGYFQALGAMHGWSDGDGYFENYLGHPIGGSVAAHIWIHNDPRYRNVEFGMSRDYWMSRLRAYAFAWASSEQFEIGPLSEASIGQIQRYCCAYGFVDHVITPNGGAVWLIGGDILDKYVIRRVEDHTHNIAVRALVRGALDPPQSFANILAGQVPWHRDNRPGIHDYDGDLYLQPSNSQPRDIRQIPTFELSATMPSVLRFGGRSCIGGGGIGAFQMPGSWQWTAEVSGCTFGNFEKGWSGDSLTFSTGPQWISHTSGRWSPHFSVRFGGQKITQGYWDPSLKTIAASNPDPGEDAMPTRYAYTRHYETTGPSLTISGGADLRLNAGLAVRVANVDYVRSWLRPINGQDFDEGYRVSTGLVLRIGTW